MKILLVGNGAREAAVARRVAEESKVFVVMKNENPSLAAFARNSGGEYFLNSVTDAPAIAEYAKNKNIDLAFVSADDPLANGVIDALQARGIKAIGATKAGSEIEWNKAFARNFLQKLAPKYTPHYWVITNKAELESLFLELKRGTMPIVVKPQGLTAGKGVKVMGEHLADFDAAQKYAQEILESRIGSSDCVVIEEKVDGLEFTIQVLCDGQNVVPVPASFDFPYRYNGDTGPGTGGMGCFTTESFPLPFMTDKVFNECVEVCRLVADGLNANNRPFTGVLYGGFILGSQGLKVIEFNSRFGDPESINIMELLDSSFTNVLVNMAEKTLKPEHLKFKRQASVVKYLVAPEYCIAAEKSHEFEIDIPALAKENIGVLFASSLAIPGTNKYKTIGNSRNVALVALDNTIPEAAERINKAIAAHFRGPLEFRSDIGAKAEIDRFYSMRSVLCKE